MPSIPATAVEGPSGGVTLEAAQRALDVFAHDLTRTVAELRSAGLDVPSTVDRRIEVAAGRTSLRPEVPIAMVGGTGSGKSTLINALLAAHVLPVSSTWACTSAVTEIAWSDRGYYSADIELVSRDEWQEELDLLERDLADARELGGDQASVSKVAGDKLRAIYGDAAAARYLVSFDRSELVEPEPIRVAFDRSRHIVESEEVAWFRQQLGLYLTSAHQLWPVVRRARIEGPFDILREGAVLVDLPGLNDPNQAREATTHEYLRSARFVWVVFKMDRGLTRDVYDLLGDGGLVHRLYMDGRTSALRLVGTASDVINPVADIAAFGLSDDASDLDIVVARSHAVEGHVRGQLRELALSIGREARAEPEQVERLCSALDRVPIHCVSAAGYHKCVGLDRPVRQVLTSVDDTGIPGLQKATRRLLANHGQSAHLEQINEELQTVRAELEQRLVATVGRLDAGHHADVRHRANSAGTATPAVTPGPAGRMLGTRTQRGVERFERAMASAGEELARRLEVAGTEAERDVAELDALWRTMHLSTMRAVLRRGGTWADRERAIDINRQIARPLFDRIPFAWVEFFGHRAVVALESLTGDLEQAMGDYLDELGGLPADHAAGPGTHTGDVVSTPPAGNPVGVDAARQLVESHLRTMQRNMAGRLESDRRRIDEEIRESVRRRMAPVYEAMLTVTGSGAREKMVDLLVSGAADASRAMHHDLTAMVNELLQGLAADLCRDAADVASRIRADGELLTRPGSPPGPTAHPGDTDLRHRQGVELHRLLEGLPVLGLRA